MLKTALRSVKDRRDNLTRLQNLLNSYNPHKILQRICHCEKFRGKALRQIHEVQSDRSGLSPMVHSMRKLQRLQVIMNNEARQPVDLRRGTPEEIISHFDDGGLT